MMYRQLLVLYLLLYCRNFFCSQQTACSSGSSFLFTREYPPCQMTSVVFLLTQPPGRPAAGCCCHTQARKAGTPYDNMHGYDLILQGKPGMRQTGVLSGPPLRHHPPCLSAALLLGQDVRAQSPPVPPPTQAPRTMCDRGNLTGQGPHGRPGNKYLQGLLRADSPPGPHTPDKVAAAASGRPGRVLTPKRSGQRGNLRTPRRRSRPIQSGLQVRELGPVHRPNCVEAHPPFLVARPASRFPPRIGEFVQRDHAPGPMARFCTGRAGSPAKSTSSSPRGAARRTSAPAQLSTPGSLSERVRANKPGAQSNDYHNTEAAC